MFGRQKKRKDSPGSTSDLDLDRRPPPTQAQIKRATRSRFVWALIASFCLLVSVIFVILVEVGNTSIKSVRNHIYFIRLDLTDIIPTSVPSVGLVNSLAQTLGLHDFYTVGLWNFCEGYNGQGTTSCSDPKTLYWFNPVAIIRGELLAGATIALPAQINDVLTLLRIVSHFMFALFLTGVCLSFLLMFLLPLGVYSRWADLPLGIFTFLSALFTTVAAVLATVTFIVMRNAITSVADLNIGASLGIEMFVFMWIAAAFSILAWLITMGMCCCCASRRDVRTGRRTGSRKAYLDDPAQTEKIDGSDEEKPEKRGFFRRKS